MVLDLAWLDLSSSHSTYGLEILYVPAVSVSFGHISQVHQLALDDECWRFWCLTDWTPEYVTHECDVTLNLYGSIYVFVLL